MRESDDTQDQAAYMQAEHPWGEAVLAPLYDAFPFSDDVPLYIELAGAAIKQGGQVLEVACGNGYFARRMVGLGTGHVVASDFSEKFLEIARDKTAKAGLDDKIEFHKVDATDESALLRLGEGRFDAAVANMALMDMAEIELAVLSRQCLDRRIPDLATLTAEVAAWEDERNRTATAIDWRFTTADARVRLTRLYPSHDTPRRGRAQQRPKSGATRPRGTSGRDG